MKFCVVKELRWNCLCLSSALWVVKLVKANKDDACKDADDTIHWLPAVTENDDKVRLPWLVCSACNNQLKGWIQSSADVVILL